MFDDLIPKKNSTVPPANSLPPSKPVGGGMFDDLIPNFKPDTFLGRIESKAKTARKNIDTTLAESDKLYKTGQQTALETIGQRGAAGFKGLADIITSPASAALEEGYSALPEPVQQKVSQAGQKVGEFISPAAQYSAEEYSKLSPRQQANLKALGNAASFGLDAVSLGAGSKVVKSVGEGVVSAIPKTAIKNAVFGTPEAQFTKSFGKAFPTMARDVKSGLPKKVESGFDVVSDILKTDSAKLTDDAGNFINPSKYSYSDLNEVFNKRMPEIYRQYTDSLSQVDKSKFDFTIDNAIKTKIDDINKQLATENLEANRRVLTQKARELATLRDRTPEGIQKYIEGLNQEAKGMPGAPLTVQQIQSANLAGAMRKTLDESIDTVGDIGGYQDARKLYGSYRTLKDQLAVLAARELRSTPGLVDRLTNMGVTAMGLEALLSANPKGLLLSLGVKAGSKVWKYFGTPERSLNNLFKIVEKDKINQLPMSFKNAANIQPNIPASINANKNVILPSIIPQQVENTQEAIDFFNKKFGEDLVSNTSVDLAPYFNRMQNATGKEKADIMAELYKEVNQSNLPKKLPAIKMAEVADEGKYYEDLLKQQEGEILDVPESVAKERIDDVTKQIEELRLAKEFDQQAYQQLKDSFAGGGFNFKTYARMRNAGVRDLESLDNAGLGDAGKGVLQQLEDYAKESGDKDILEMMEQADAIIALGKNLRGASGVKELMAQKKRLISDEAVAKAREVLNKAGKPTEYRTLGITTEELRAAATIGARYIEDGVRTAVELGERLAKEGYELTKAQVEKIFIQAQTLQKGARLDMNKIDEAETLLSAFSDGKFSSPQMSKSAKKFLTENGLDYKPNMKDDETHELLGSMVEMRKDLRQTVSNTIPKELQPLAEEARKTLLKKKK